MQCRNGTEPNGTDGRTDGCIHHRFHWSALFRKLLAAAETDGKKLLDSVFELGFKESEVQRAAWKRT